MRWFLKNTLPKNKTKKTQSPQVLYIILTHSLRSLTHLKYLQFLYTIIGGRSLMMWWAYIFKSGSLQKVTKIIIWKSPNYSSFTMVRFRASSRKIIFINICICIYLEHFISSFWIMYLYLVTSPAQTDTVSSIFGHWQSYYYFSCFPQYIGVEIKELIWAQSADVQL